MELHQLEEIELEDDEAEQVTLRVPANATNLCRNKVIDFVPVKDAAYGLKLINKSGRDLYPYVFYFDNTNLSIRPFYKSISTALEGAKVDSPLKMNGSLTIGYGAGGVNPFYFQLEPGRDMDVNFLKIFVCTAPVDFSLMEQESPFVVTRGMAQKPPPKRKRNDVWDSILVPVIHRRWPQLIEPQLPSFA
ncbi:hypothetical protein CPB84DRAFT_1689513 [Gymnopilus junonius]|uniref:Uncharacterized protein n=1 Tax=Gymnopilus junonius TaxID=109634 RepID=A0A9P5TFV0_GYMJU|nr:hypothetical protein CPB84DRAFT_1689513 [Gymnopilus junonius]